MQTIVEFKSSTTQISKAINIVLTKLQSIFENNYCDQFGLLIKRASFVFIDQNDLQVYYILI